MDDIKKTDNINTFDNTKDKIDYDKISLYLKIGMLGAFSVGNMWTLIGHYIILVRLKAKKKK